MKPLIALAQEVKECRQCRLFRTCKQRVPGMGIAQASIMFVMQAPSWEEDKQGTPWAGNTNLFLNRLVANLGYKEADVYVTHLVKCYPGRSVQGDKLPPILSKEACSGWLKTEMAIVKPKLIVAVGAVVMRWYGIKGGINKNSGRIFETPYGPVLTIRHPNGLLRHLSDVPKLSTELKAMDTFFQGASPLPEWGIKETEYHGYMGVDTEIEDDKVWCLGLANSTGREAKKEYVDWIGGGIDQSIPVFQNAKFDMKYLEKERGIVMPEWEDTILQAHLLGHKPLNLPSMTSVFLGVQLDKTFVVERKKVSFDKRPDVVLNGCSEDAAATYKLNDLFLPEIDKQGWRSLYERDKKLTRVLMSMEITGLPVSQDRLKIARRVLLKRMGALEVLLMQHGIDSPNDKVAIGQKFWRNKRKVVTTESGQLSTKKDELREHRFESEVEWTEALIEWRALAKFQSTYINAWTGKDFVHASINQTGTISWRCSVSDPNLQNVPKVKDIPLYQLFVAPPGWVFISLDYSQIDLRVLANITGDKALLTNYRPTKEFPNGRDLHERRVKGVPSLNAMASRLDDPEFWIDKARRIAKIINFGIPYGITGHGVSRRTRVEAGIDITKDEGAAMVEGFYRDHPAVKPWQEEQQAHARKYGYVENFAGRPLWVPGMQADKGKIRYHAEKQCSNLPVQGGAAEIVGDAMIRCPEYLVMQVHDELLYLVPEKQAEEYFEYLKVALVDERHEIPYTIDGAIGRTWGDIKHIPDVIFTEGDEE